MGERAERGSRLRRLRFRTHFQSDGESYAYFANNLLRSAANRIANRIGEVTG